MLVGDLMASWLRFWQYSMGRFHEVKSLAGGYLCTALIAAPRTLPAPEVLSQTGLLGAGPQTAAYLYIAAHAALPLTIIAATLQRQHAVTADDPTGGTTGPIAGTVLATVLAVVATTLLVTRGHQWLPPLIDNGYYTIEARIAVGALLAFPLAALVLLAWTARPPSTLDLWLMVTMLAWLCTIALGAFISRGRYDIGWYIGTLFDWLTSIFVLLILISQMILLYGRQASAAAAAQRLRERPIHEME